MWVNVLFQRVLAGWCMLSLLPNALSNASCRYTIETSYFSESWQSNYNWTKSADNLSMRLCVLHNNHLQKENHSWISQATDLKLAGSMQERAHVRAAWKSTVQFAVLHTITHTIAASGQTDKASLVLCFRLDPVEKSLLLTVSSISQVNLTTTVLLTLTTLIKLLQTEEICLPTILIFVLFFVVA